MAGRARAVDEGYDGEEGYVKRDGGNEAKLLPSYRELDRIVNLVDRLEAGRELYAKRLSPYRVPKPAPSMEDRDDRDKPDTSEFVRRMEDVGDRLERLVYSFSHLITELEI